LTLKRAREITGGGLSYSTKVGHTFNLPALASCPTGERLAKQPNTVCSHCYAKRGHFTIPSVTLGHARRLKAVRDAQSSTPSGLQWLIAMRTLIEHTSTKYFRLHSSGDLFSKAYARLWYITANHFKHINFWIPTHEKWAPAFFSALPNVTVRLSAQHIGSLVDRDLYGPSCSVSSNIGHLCPATYHHDGKPADKSCSTANCRACWDRSVPNVDYKLH